MSDSPDPSIRADQRSSEIGDSKLTDDKRQRKPYCMQGRITGSSIPGHMVRDLVGIFGSREFKG
jgi:hypothetical protein